MSYASICYCQQVSSVPKPEQYYMQVADSTVGTSLKQMHMHEATVGMGPCSETALGRPTHEMQWALSIEHSLLEQVCGTA